MGKDYASMGTAALQRLLPKLIARANGERAGLHRDLTDAEREDARSAAWEVAGELRRRGYGSPKVRAVPARESAPSALSPPPRRWGGRARRYFRRRDRARACDRRKPLFPVGTFSAGKRYFPFYLRRLSTFRAFSPVGRPPGKKSPVFSGVEMPGFCARSTREAWGGAGVPTRI